MPMPMQGKQEGGGHGAAGPGKCGPCTPGMGPKGLPEMENGAMDGTFPKKETGTMEVEVTWLAPETMAPAWDIQCFSAEGKLAPALMRTACGAIPPYRRPQLFARCACCVN